MADARFRELERRAVQGDQEAAGLLAQERRRAGDREGVIRAQLLDPRVRAPWDCGRCLRTEGGRVVCLACHRTGRDHYRSAVKLAAHLGDEDAQRALGEHSTMGAAAQVGQHMRDEDDWFYGWVRSLSFAWPSEVIIRAALAAGREARDSLGRELSDDRGHQEIANPGLAVLEAAEDWVVFPCAEHLEACDDLIVRVASDDLHWAWLAAAVIVFGGHAEIVRNNPERAEVCEQIDEPGTWLDRAAELAGEANVLRAVREELVPWALGERDPVKERVEARRTVAGTSTLVPEPTSKFPEPTTARR